MTVADIQKQLDDAVALITAARAAVGKLPAPPVAKFTWKEK